MNIIVVDEFEEVEKTFENVDKKAVVELVGLAQKENLPCLSFIDTARQDTYFSNKQLWQIKKEEIDNLKKHPEIKSILDIVEEGMLLALKEDYTYLKFEPIN